eukprot:scaffold1805_cov104-Cylindrotheca_fusiformis.AAC.8
MGSFYQNVLQSRRRSLNLLERREKTKPNSISIRVLLLVLFAVFGVFQLLNISSNEILHQSIMAQEPTLLDVDSVWTKNSRNNAGNDRASDGRGPGQCKRILLYATDYLNPNGLVSQLNTLLRAALVAIVEGRRLVFLHSSDDGMFGCRDNKTTSKCSGGLSQLIDISPLSNGCEVPTCYKMPKWHRLAYRVIQRKNMDPEFSCMVNKTTNDTVSVLLLGGHPIREYFREKIQPYLENGDQLEKWAPRVGATASQVESMMALQAAGPNQDEYRMQVMSLLMLMIRWQPWIYEDLKMLQDDDNNSVSFLEHDYTAIHIRRGDKLLVEARPWVEQYWKNQGYTNGTLPRNYIPLTAYLQLVPATAEHVYIATDDVRTVQKEIQELSEEPRYQFHFNPLSTSGHLNSLSDSQDQYRHTIAAIFDLQVLTSAQIFVGEFNSNWGRWVHFQRQGQGVRIVFGPTEISWPR